MGTLECPLARCLRDARRSAALAERTLRVTLTFPFSSRRALALPRVRCVLCVSATAITTASDRREDRGQAVVVVAAETPSLRTRRDPNSGADAMAHESVRSLFARHSRHGASWTPAALLMASTWRAHTHIAQSTIILLIARASHILHILWREYCIYLILPVFRLPEMYFYVCIVLAPSTREFLSAFCFMHMVEIARVYCVQ